MKFLFIIYFSLFVAVQAATIYQPQPDNLFIVDNFEDADITKFPEWWGFDDINLTIQPNNPLEFDPLGQRSLELSGQPENWYVGGAGTYFAIDTQKYNAIKMLIRGYGKKSGVLIVELFDDDNNNFMVEKHPDIPSETLADDKFIHTVKINWEGWKVVIIPFDKFVDGNLTIGDDLWNPYQTDSSGGLLQMQLVLLAADKKVDPRIRIDSIKFYYQGEMPVKNESKSGSLDDYDFF